MKIATNRPIARAAQAPRLNVKYIVGARRGIAAAESPSRGQALGTDCEREGEHEAENREDSQPIPIGDWRGESIVRGSRAMSSPSSSAGSLRSSKRQRDRESTVDPRGNPRSVAEQSCDERRGEPTFLRQSPRRSGTGHLALKEFRSRLGLATNLSGLAHKFRHDW